MEGENLTIFPEHLLTGLNLCIRCGACNSVCPLYLAGDGMESHGPRSFLQISKLVGEGELEITIEFVEYVYECTLCELCDTACPVGINISQMIQSVRGSLIDQGYVPPPPIASMPTRFWEEGLSVGARARKGAWLPSKHEPPAGDKIFFATCLSSIAPESATAALHLLKKSVELETIGEQELCCGALLRLAGYRYLAQDALDNLMEQLASFNPSKIIVPVVFCLENLRERSDIEIVHVVEAAFDAMRSGSLTFKSSKKLRVGLVKSCDIPTLNDKSLELLSSIDGLDVVELPAWSYCGSGCFLSFYAGSEGVREQFTRILMVSTELNLEAIVFVDSSFYVVAREVARESGIKIDVLDIQQLLLRFL